LAAPEHGGVVVQAQQAAAAVIGFVNGGADVQRPPMRELRREWSGLQTG
jgi:hypothetical protein